MISKELMTMPVVVEDSTYRETFVIMYAPEEGAEFRVIVCHDEVQADRYMRDYVRTGTIRVVRGYLQDMIDIIEPIVALKLCTMRAVRKEFRMVRVEDGSIIDPDEILSSEVSQ